MSVITPEPGVVNAWKMENRAKNKWVVLICKKNSDKMTWLDALKEERKQVGSVTTSSCFFVCFS